MSNNKKNNVWGKWILWFVFAVAIIIVYKTLDSFSDVKNGISGLLKTLMPFTMGILIAGLLYIPAKKIETIYKKPNNKILKRMSRGLSVLTTYILVIIIIVMAFKFIIPRISDSISDLLNDMPKYYNEAIKQINSIPDNDIITKDELKQKIKDMQSIDFEKYLSIEHITEYIKGFINLATGIFDFFVAIIVSIYILLERDDIINFSKKALRALIKNDEKYNQVCKYFRASGDVFFKFLGGQICDAVVVGIITSIAMAILKVEYAGLLGFMIGIFNLIPYFGAIFAVGIAILITMFTGGIVQAIWLAVVVIILQQIDANIINPRIIGSSLKISPILVIFSVTIGGAYFGVLGMFLGVPIASVIKIILVDYIEHKNRLNEEEKNKAKRKAPTRIRKTIIGEEGIIIDED